MGRIIIVGDTHQCQPAGTMVDVVVRKGERWNRAIVEKRPIESLQVGDIVVSLRTQERQWSRSRKINKVASHFYKGELVRIDGDNFTSRYTPNHRCLVSFNSMKETWCVYLMKKGNQYRVGKSKMNYNTASGPVARMSVEGADAIWILSLHESDYEARIEEYAVALKFGIPQLVFVSGYGLSFSQEDLSKIWDIVGDNTKQGEDCLAHFRRLPEYPIFSGKRDYTKSLKRSMFTQACNLVPGCLVLPYKHGSDPIGSRNQTRLIVRKTDFVPAKVTYEYYEGMVYSLEIDKDETYVADGIVTHNSIFGFRGADVDAIPSFQNILQSRPNGFRQFPLSVCRRCPKSHIRLAQSIVPDIKWMTVENSGTDAPEGEIYQLTEDEAVNRMVEGDMGVSRVNKVLIPIAYQLIKQKKKVIIRGRDIGTGLITLIKKMKSKSIPELLVKLSNWYERELAKIMKKEKVDNPALITKGADKLQSIEDKIGCIEALCDGIETLDELISNINQIFGDFDDSGKPKNAVVLGTVHRTKGLEAYSVTVIDPENFPHRAAKKNFEIQQEKNLAYVSVTRSKFLLSKDGSMIEPGRLTFVGKCPNIFKGYWLYGMKKYPKENNV